MCGEFAECSCAQVRADVVVYDAGIWTMKFEYSGTNYKSVQIICYSLLHLEQLRLPNRLSALETMGSEPETRSYLYAVAISRHARRAVYDVSLVARMAGFSTVWRETLASRHSVLHLYVFAHRAVNLSHQVIFIGGHCHERS